MCWVQYTTAMQGLTLLWPLVGELMEALIWSSSFKAFFPSRTTCIHDIVHWVVNLLYILTHCRAAHDCYITLYSSIHVHVVCVCLNSVIVWVKRCAKSGVQSQEVHVHVYMYNVFYTFYILIRTCTCIIIITILLFGHVQCKCSVILS